jgi:glutaredoxin 2
MLTKVAGNSAVAEQLREVTACEDQIEDLISLRFLNQGEVALQDIHLFFHFRDLFRGQAFDDFVC